MKTIPLLRVLALLLTALPAALHAQVPQLINYQNRVAVGTTNFQGTCSFKFTLVDSNGIITPIFQLSGPYLSFQRPSLEKQFLSSLTSHRS